MDNWIICFEIYSLYDLRYSPWQQGSTLVLQTTFVRDREQIKSEMTDHKKDKPYL